MKYLVPAATKRPPMKNEGNGCPFRHAVVTIVKTKAIKWHIRPRIMKAIVAPFQSENNQHLYNYLCCTVINKIYST